ncbi:MAG TPA: YCF48-related protein [Thermoanaerobaculia bacterium]|nr:YCF48-related protein [Thermoanaerobaculia bacterium]
MTSLRRLPRRRLAGVARWAAPALFVLPLLLTPGGSRLLAQESEAAGVVVEPAVPARLAPRSLLLDAVERGPLWVAVGERGHVLVSADRGATWTQAKVPTRALLTGVWMHDERLGWAVGHDETILRTRDGGATWESVHADPDAERPLLDVWFRDADNGFAIGAYGAFLVTSDGGTTWSERPISEDDFHLNQLAAAADGTLYIAAEAGHLYRSSDRGESWQALAAPYGGSFFGFLPLSDGAVLVFGLRGRLYRSEDRGATWTAVASATEATLMAGVELAGGRVVVAGLAGTLLASDDLGRTFRSAPQDDRKGNVALLGAANRLVLFGEGGARPLENFR